MTEPEELDEDLFADLYDQDEVPAKPETSMKVEAPSETVDVPDPGGNGTITDQAMQDVKQEPTLNVPEPQHNNNNSMLNGDVGSAWQDGHDVGRNGNHYDDSAAEPDSHGTGIKEDG
ncbi:hypothetical protein MMC30_006498 [Trapelia coarctata]|nr:hypothetical protein [Trapelia coarctata]